MSTPAALALSADWPFPGLRPFDTADAEFFFGREDQIFSLYRLIDGSQFVAVVGSSGSGKSSLVRAGLLPLLEKETQDSVGRNWVCRTMTPGNAPIAQLARLLAGLTKDEDPRIADARRERISFDLRQSSFGIAETLAKINLPAKSSLLLVVDQFEELFRYSASNARSRPAPRRREEADQFVQLLIEASRSPAQVHVLITMRSDFIGDCAVFPELPEAVSAAQFLVPSLSRDQLEEVICKPVELADEARKHAGRPGASIAEDLVQGLLNDVSEEPDKLPILQHCLMRLWERAGKPGEKLDGAAGAAAPADSPSERAHHLDLDHYKSVERIAGALSQHADEIMKNLEGRKLAVEQVFRALSEVDREGRAIRRAIPFGQLVAEICGDATAPGLPPGHVREVLDRFRADDCSFLTPSSSAVPELKPESTIDVGHEALIRRWEAVSGKADLAGTDTAAKGWLKAEEYDGQQYRVLLACLGRDGRGMLPAERIDDWLTWWKSPPRTPAWAKRYGDKYDLVKRLLKESQIHRRSVVWRKRAVAGLVLLLLMAGGLLAIKNYQQQHEMEAANINAAFAINQANNLLSRILAGLQRGLLTADAARDLLQSAGSFEEPQSPFKDTPQTSKVRMTVLILSSDISVTIGDFNKALNDAKAARNLAEKSISDDPSDLMDQQFIYDSTWRIADVLVALSRSNVDQSLQEYRRALDLAKKLTEKLPAKKPEDKSWQREVSFIHGKIGDCLAIQRKPIEALTEYREGARIMQAVADQMPDRTDWQRDLASSISRIGQALQAQRKYSEALEQYRISFDIRAKLVANSDNDGYRSNLALSYAEIGGVLELLNKPDDALAEYRKGIELREPLVAKDPGNSIWQDYLATLYQRTGNLLRNKMNRLPEAADVYAKMVAIRHLLADRDPGNASRQQRLATDVETFGGFFFDQKRFDDALRVYQWEVVALERLTKLNPDDTAWKVRRALAISKIGDVLVDQSHANDALVQYQLAAKILENLIADNKCNAECQKLRETIKDKMQTQASVR